MSGRKTQLGKPRHKHEADSISKQMSRFEAEEEGQKENNFVTGSQAMPVRPTDKDRMRLKTVG
jgi:hypothetical protein